MTERRIIDTFLFDGELDLLEHRLAETYDLVDRFVLVEAGETFQGEPKRLHFTARRERFAQYAAKIRHLALPHLGVRGAGPSGDPSEAWARERFQRNALLFGLSDAAPDDIILLLDADEIPSRELLQRLRSEGLDVPRRVLMTRHYEAVDVLGPASPCCPSRFLPFPFALSRKRPPAWNLLGIEWFSRSGVALPFQALLLDNGSQRLAPFDVRRSAPLAGALPNAGRHLCFVDPSARPERKLGRSAHTELATARGQAPEHLARCARYAVHHRGWWYGERPSGELPGDLVRLVERCPGMQVGRQFRPALLRHAVRTWAWCRGWKVLPEGWVRRIDAHFKALSLLTVPLLLTLDVGRALVLKCQRTRKGRVWAEAEHRGS